MNILLNRFICLCSRAAVFCDADTLWMATQLPICSKCALREKEKRYYRERYMRREKKRDREKEREGERGEKRGGFRKYQVMVSF